MKEWGVTPELHRKISMSADKRTAWSYVEGFHADDDSMLSARERGLELGVESVAPSVASTLTVLATALSPMHVVEVGTGVGISSLALLRGMKPQGALTTIDPDVEHLRAARENFLEAGVSLSRIRSIAGRGQDVLPRLTTGAYDLVFIDADRENAAEYAEMSARLLKAGGLLVIHNALDYGRVPQPAVRSLTTVSMRNAARFLQERDDFTTALSPVSDGLLMAAKTRAAR
jgi:predicted O-methyltransferase YrrM